MCREVELTVSICIDVDNERLHVTVGLAARQGVIVHVLPGIEGIVRKADGIVGLSVTAYYRTGFIGLVVEEGSQTYPQSTCQLYQRGKRRYINVFFDAGYLFNGKPGTVCQFIQTYFFGHSEASDLFSDNVGFIHSISSFC